MHFFKKKTSQTHLDCTLDDADWVVLKEWATLLRAANLSESQLWDLIHAFTSQASLSNSNANEDTASILTPSLAPSSPGKGRKATRPPSVLSQSSRLTERPGPSATDGSSEEPTSTPPKSVDNAFSKAQFLPDSNSNVEHGSNNGPGYTPPTINNSFGGAIIGGNTTIRSNSHNGNRSQQPMPGFPTATPVKRRRY